MDKEITTEIDTIQRDKKRLLLKNITVVKRLPVVYNKRRVFDNFTTLPYGYETEHKELTCLTLGSSSSSHCLPLTRNRRNSVTMVARLPTPPPPPHAVIGLTDFVFPAQKADGAVLDPPGCQINLLPLGASRFLG